MQALRRPSLHADRPIFSALFTFLSDKCAAALILALTKLKARRDNLCGRSSIIFVLIISRISLRLVCRPSHDIMKIRIFEMLVIFIRHYCIRLALITFVSD